MREIVIMSRYEGYGDAIFVNTVAWHYGELHQKKVIIGTNHPAIYKHNPWVKIFPLKTEKAIFRFARVLRILGFKVIHYNMTYQKELQETPKIMNALAKKCGLDIDIVQPKIFLTEKEKKYTFPNTNKPWIAIQSSGRKDWTDNRNWYAERYQAVVDNLLPKYNIVQLGYPLDPALKGTYDLRGQTQVRELFSVFSNVKLFIGQAGFLMHAAEAVSCKSVIIYGGFEWHRSHGYLHQSPIESKVACAPCWQLQCPYNKKCMDEIGVEDVLKVVEEIL